MPNRVELLPKPLSVARLYTFDFASDLAVNESISSATMTIAVYSGVDPSPASMVGAQQPLAGTPVKQIIQGGVLGVIYKVTMTIVTTLPQTLAQIGYLAVIPDLP